jgi:hypothetical protein
MKNNNTRTIFKFSFLLYVFTSMAWVGVSTAGDYYVYRDGSGKLVISNTTPPTGSKIIRQETLPEVTDQQIAEARAREENTAIENRTATLEKTLGELSDNLRVQSQILGNLQQGLAENNVAVGVTEGPGFVTRPLRRFDHIPNPGDLPHRPPRVMPRTPRTGRAG